MDSTMRLNFDKLKFVKNLSSQGYTQEQSEALAEAFSEALTESQFELATRHDLNLLKDDLKSTENRLLYAIGGGFVATITILISIMGLIKFI
ncbi:hypothetical protein QV08_07540 [Gallibacterium salpingitidis]|uniref:DUF1640 domain-containing protein n=1 Tax=Gallibacterium salpingitidis TaxID=505341 RepID=A0AB36E4B9_9PAST|nr:hypothetical protein [Gallibacterium salpingitidis]OBX07409.1 hypothetical protein QV08_07540 [Gallibacterium salpingitidis]OBX11529.1 hypothetical protein QV09_02125 [Gallibacterium salpingitidis]